MPVIAPIVSSVGAMIAATDTIPGSTLLDGHSRSVGLTTPARSKERQRSRDRLQDQPCVDLDPRLGDPSSRPGTDQGQRP
jgi:hypothetical protein